jgi:excisionase family DNA binding protein
VNAYLTVEEVAQLARCEHRCVRRAVQSGQLQAFRPARRILVREDDARAWIESRPAAASPQQAQRRRPVSQVVAGPGSVARLKAIEVSADTQRRSMTLLQGIMKRAVVRSLIPANPVAQVQKPRQHASEPQPLSPATIEQIRVQLRPRDAMIVSLLAYAGLRPVEDRGARWADARDRTLRVAASKLRPVACATSICFPRWPRISPAGVSPPVAPRRGS